jgi:signal peptidase I
MFDLLKGLLKLTVWIAVPLLIAAAVLRIFFVDVAVVGHDGMAPTLVAGEYVAIWRNAAANIGDVLICQHPGEPGKHVMGRVLAKAGYTVTTDRFGQVVVGDVTVKRDFRGERRFYDTARQEMVDMAYGIAKFGYFENEFFIQKGKKPYLRATTVKTGVYLLGDNYTSEGNDSRYFGEVDPETCVGQVFMRLWPAEDRGDDIDHLPLSLI